MSEVLWILVASGGLAIVVAHHLAYFRKTRPTSFGAFVETAGWLILVLVAIAAVGGGMGQPSTRVVEIAAAIVGLLLVGVGAQFK